MTGSDSETILVPIANLEDATRTGGAIAERFDGSSVVAIHVINKAGGAPDPAGLEQRESFAERLFEALRGGVRNTDITIETRIEYGTDVADAILSVGDQIAADAIVFVPRGDRRWRQVLTGDVARKLLNRTNRPIVVLPGPGGNA